MQDISYTVHTFKEGATYIAYVPELDLSSCGATKVAAQKNIRDAVQGFLERVQRWALCGKFSRRLGTPKMAIPGEHRSLYRSTGL
jgi:hypothetical protein